MTGLCLAARNATLTNDTALQQDAQQLLTGILGLLGRT